MAPRKPQSGNELSAGDWARRYGLLKAVGELALSDLPDGKLLKELTDALIEASGADGGFLLRVPEGGGRWEVALARNYWRGDIQSPEFAVSRTLIDRALDEGCPVIIADTAAQATGDVSRSMLRLGVLSAMVLPLSRADGKRPFAAIYLDRKRPGGLFSEADLDMLADVMVWGNRALDLALDRGAIRAAATIHPLIRAELIGESPALVPVVNFLDKAAKSDATVLLRGETGTGKELIAQLLHRLSRTASGPFIAVNCAAIPRELLESELFGHEAGAFTGATSRRIGKFQEAAGGTLFLDEIGDMPLELQAKMLRVVETRKFSVLGGRDQNFTARLVAATHQPLEKLAREGKFRQDLFYRLAVLEITLPPLRQRRGDIPLLAEHFIGAYTRRTGKPPVRLAPAAARYLQRRAWPGNIRELAHLIERALTFCDSPVLERGDFTGVETLDAEPAASAPPQTAAELRRRRQQLIEVLDRQFVESLLRQHQGDVAQAARSAGLTRARLYQMIKLHLPAPGGKARKH